MNATIDNSAASLANSVWDVVVIGAGPAGAMAAREAARCGRRTLLVEAGISRAPKFAAAVSIGAGWPFWRRLAYTT